MDIAELLMLTLDRKGSDLHITVGLPPSVRIHGEVEPLPMPVLSRDDTHTLVYGIMNDAQKARFEGTRDIDFSLDFGEAGRFRVNAFFGRQGVGAVFRVIPTRIRSVAELGIPQVVSQLAEFDRGLVLVTGPTGSGKSTTLAALIDQIIDVFPPHQQSQVRAMISESIRGIVAQHLLKTIDGSGRAAALEIMIGTPAVRNLIREGKSYQLNSVIQTGTKEGMQTLDQSLRELLRAGRISWEDAMKKVSDKEAF